METPGGSRTVRTRCATFRSADRAAFPRALLFRARLDEPLALAFVLTGAVVVCTAAGSLSLAGIGAHALDAGLLAVFRLNRRSNEQGGSSCRDQSSLERILHVSFSFWLARLRRTRFVSRSAESPLNDSDPPLDVQVTHGKHFRFPEKLKVSSRSSARWNLAAFGVSGVDAN